VKVGLVSRYFPPYIRGGSHLSVFYIAKGLAERGHEVHVFTTQSEQAGRQTSKQGELIHWEQPGISRHEVFSVGHPVTAWGLDHASLRMGWQLRRYLNECSLRLDILHAYGMDTIPAVVMSQASGQPVGTVNGYWATCPFWDHTQPATRTFNPVCSFTHLGKCIAERDSQHSKGRQLAKRLFLFSSLRLRRYYVSRLKLLLPISYSVQSILQMNGLQQQQSVVCYNMIDLVDYTNLDDSYLYRRFNIPAGQRILLHAGRFAPYKGSNDILQAAPALIAEHSDVHFVFVGQGSTMPALQARVKELGLEGCVTVGDSVNPKEMPHVYASAYLTLHTATWPEPFARGPIEAMAAGTVVIGTATGGTPEAITDGETGLLIPPFNAAAIASACHRLLANPPLRQRIAKQGQELVQRRFTIDAQVGCYVAAYESIL
jgi:glycosyltransferase involved in cell wall biosynthesis